MSKHSHCPSCRRVYRSKAAREAAENYKIVHDDLRASIAIPPTDTEMERRVRHRAHSDEFRLRGAFDA